MICIFFDIDDTLLKYGAYDYVVDNYTIDGKPITWVEYNQNVKLISKMLRKDTKAYEYLIGSKLRIQMIKQWLKNMHKMGIKLITLTANYNCIVLPLLNEMGILKYFSANIDRTHEDYNYKTPISKSVIMTKMKKKHDFKHIIFVDDCKYNISMARLFRIKSFYINSGIGIDDKVILDMNKYINILMS
mgnify:CR=1 FL=1